MITEGKQVSYVGDDPYVGVGTRGKVISLSGSALHVQWMEGEKRGSIELVPEEELVPYRKSAVFDEPDEGLAITASMIREAVDEQGTDSLIDMLEGSGHLAMLSTYAAEAIGFVSMRLRDDGNLAPVLAVLDESEQDALVSRVATVLIADHLTDED